MANPFGKKVFFMIGLLTTCRQPKWGKICRPTRAERLVEARVTYALKECEVFKIQEVKESDELRY